MTLIFIGLAVFIASIFGTLVGFGISTILIPILTIFLPLTEVIFFVAIIHWFGSLWKIILFKKGLRWDIILYIGIIGIFATVVGAVLIKYLHVNKYTHYFGIFLIAYMIFIYLQPRFKLQINKFNLLLGGAASGFFAGLFGMGGAIRSLLMNMFDLPKTIYLATSGAIAIVIDTTRLSTYYFSGLTIPLDLMYGLIVYVPISLFGSFISKSIVKYIPQAIFRLVIALFIGLAGIYFIIFG